MDFGDVISLFSALIAAGSLAFTIFQWKKIREKVGTIEDGSIAMDIMPTWFTTRMMKSKGIDGTLGGDYWCFGLLLLDGRTVVITRILSISDNGAWMNVELALSDDWSLEEKECYVFAVAEDRRNASIQVSSVQVAMELITS